MTLLDATAILIEHARTSGSDDRKLQQAVRRMERRYDVLRLRKLKALRRSRNYCWRTFCHILGPSPHCPRCNATIDYRTFVHHAQLSGKKIKQLECPNCDFIMLTLLKSPTTRQPTTHSFRSIASPTPRSARATARIIRLTETDCHPVDE